MTRSGRTSLKSERESSWASKGLASSASLRARGTGSVCKGVFAPGIGYGRQIDVSELRVSMVTVGGAHLNEQASDCQSMCHSLFRLVTLDTFGVHGNNELYERAIVRLEDRLGPSVP